MDSSSGGSYGIPQKRLHGHGHFVSDVVCLQMDTLPCLDLGIKLFVYGICQQETQHDDSKAT